MLKYKEMENLSVEELQSKELEVRREIYELMGQLRVTKKLKTPHLLKQNKKDRARILTALRTKKGHYGREQKKN